MNRRLIAALAACVMLTGCASDTRTRDAQGGIALMVLAGLLPPVAATLNPGPEKPMPVMIAYPGDDVPLIRGVTKSPEVLTAVAAFLKQAEHNVGSKFSAAFRLRQYAWTAFYKGDYRTAALRFNQSLLLEEQLRRSLCRARPHRLAAR